MDFLRRCALVLLLIATVPLGAQDHAGDWRPLGDDLRVRPLTEGLWLYESDTQWGSRTVPANGLIVHDRDEIAVIDTPWTEEQTARLLDWVAEELKAPVVALLGTHFHPDAFGGIAEAHRRGIVTWGHALTGEHALENDREVPKRTFDDRQILSVGGQRVEAVYLGPGHSPDNFMVWLPARRILYGGCALKAASWTSLGYLGDADLERWPAMLEAAARTFDAVTVIPGHGPPGGPELFAHTLDLLQRQADRAAGNRGEGPD